MKTVDDIEKVLNDEELDSSELKNVIAELQKWNLSGEDDCANYINLIQKVVMHKNFKETPSIVAHFHNRMMYLKISFRLALLTLGVYANGNYSYSYYEFFKDIKTHQNEDVRKLAYIVDFDEFFEEISEQYNEDFREELELYINKNKAYKYSKIKEIIDFSIKEDIPIFLAENFID